VVVGEGRVVERADHPRQGNETSESEVSHSGRTVRKFGYGRGIRRERGVERGRESGVERKGGVVVEVGRGGG
jgi:hypothetical protein